MTSTGEVFPTSGTSVSEAPWSDNTWGTDAANITADDGTYAAVTETTFDNGDQTHVLKAQGFDFSSIPDGSTINGVTVRIQSRADSTSVGIDLVQLLSTAGAKVGTNKSDTSQRLTTSDAVYSFGGSADLWGNTLTAAWVKDADFGVAVGGHAYTANSEIYVDYVTVEIDYTEPAPPSGEYTILTSQAPDTEDPASGQERMLGLRFTSTTDGTVVRGRWYVGATATSAATTALWQLWRTSDTTKLVEVDVKALGDSTTNGWIEFDVPDTAIVADTQYVVTRYTDDNYPFNYVDPGTFPATNGPLSADTGVFINNGTANDFPSNTDTAMFFVDVVANYGTSPTPISLSDAGTGSEAISVAAATSAPDSGTGTQALTISATSTAIDTGTSTQSLAVSVPTALADTGSGTETLTAGIAIGLADAGTGTETSAIAAALNLAETGTGTETPQVAAAVPLTQSGTGTETVTVSAATGLTDTGLGADSLIAGITIPLTDVGTATENLTVLPVIALADTGTGTQTVTIGVLAALAESGAVVELLTTSAMVSLADTGSGLDALATLRPVALAESGTGNDILDVFEGLPYEPALVGVDSSTTAGTFDGRTTSGAVDSSTTAGVFDHTSRQPAELAGITSSSNVD